MSLNISDAETCRMADELARMTGETATGAVTDCVTRAAGTRAEQTGCHFAGARIACHWPTLRRSAGAGAGCGRARGTALRRARVAQVIFGVRQVREHRRSAHAESTHQRYSPSCSASRIRPGRRRWIGGLLLSGMKKSPLPGQRGLFLSTERELKEAVNCSPRWQAGCSGLPGL